MTFRRHSFEHDGLVFSYLDGGGTGTPLVALHGHWMGGSDFTGLVQDLGPDWRVIALDQRGFGETDHGGEHALPAYVGDVVALLDHLLITGPVNVLGHSFGGVVAYHFAALHPDRVRAMVIEEIGVDIHDDSSAFVRPWIGTYRLREDLEGTIGPRLAPYLQDSIQRVKEGWRLNFEIDEFLLSEKAINGDHRAIWRESQCPALVIAGSESRVCASSDLEQMAVTRALTSFLVLEAGHSVHIDARTDFAGQVRSFFSAQAEMLENRRS